MHSSFTTLDCWCIHPCVLKKTAPLLPLLTLHHSYSLLLLLLSLLYFETTTVDHIFHFIVLFSLFILLSCGHSVVNDSSKITELLNSYARSILSHFSPVYIYFYSLFVHNVKKERKKDASVHCSDLFSSGQVKKCLLSLSLSLPTRAVTSPHLSLFL